jgi:protein TonB
MSISLPLGQSVFARIGVSILLGTLVTFLLLWVMQILIATGKGALSDNKDFAFADFVRVRQEEMLERKKPKPKKPPKPEEQPPDVPPPQMDDLDTSGQSITIGRVDVNTGVSIGGIGGFQSVDGEYLPIVKVAPIYPRRAQSRGLSGHCILQFTVTAAGTTADVKSLECSSSVFERSSISAAAKFKYKPRVVDGVPIDTPGVKHRITFQIED